MEDIKVLFDEAENVENAETGEEKKKQAEGEVSEGEASAE